MKSKIKETKVKKIPKIINKTKMCEPLLRQFSDQQLLNEIILRSGSSIGLPKKSNCSECHQAFWIKWNRTTNIWSKMHNFSLWSESEEDKEKTICSSDLRKYYLNLENRKNISLQNKRHLSSLIAKNII